MDDTHSDMLAQTFHLRLVTEGWEVTVHANQGAIVFEVASCLRTASASAGARCSAADALLDDWFLADPKAADVKQMQTLVEHTLTHQQMELDHGIK